MFQDDKKWAGLSRRTFLGAAAAATSTRLAMGQQAAARQSTRSRTIEADVVVVGGGLSGVCAALAAARGGATVALIQDRSVLGGNSSSEVRMHIVGADHHGGRTDTDSRESGIIEELRLDDAVWNPQRSAASWDLLLYDKVRSESRIRLLLGTSCVGARLGARNTISAVIAERPATHDRFEASGRVFVDATGDGRVGFDTGADFRVGRESRREFGESMAPEEADSKVLGSSILFTTRRQASPVAFRRPSWAKTYATCEELPHRSHSSWEYGYWWVELGGDRDTIRDDEAIRDELLAAALGVWDHIKNSGRHPESANWGLEWIGFIPGKRESRRLIGDYIMRQSDVEGGEIFEDGIAYGGWPLDLHPPEGIYSSEKPNTAVAVPLYNIPYRSVYSRNIPNLFMAGRNISTSHVAFGSTRVMATCAGIGQAVGIAAALCVRNSSNPKDLCGGIGELQQLLLRNDLYVVGSTNCDALDWARKCGQILASSERTGSEASNVINGTARGVYARSNRWASNPEAPLPAWIELRLPELRRIREVHLVFDTGLNRQLTLTHSDAHNAKIIRAAQPETVRDYRLEAIHGESRTTVAEVTGNYQRRNAHRIAPTEMNAIRLTVTATNGDKSARVFEVRLYE